MCGFHVNTSVYRFQALKLNPVEYLRFANCYGKASEEAHACHSNTFNINGLTVSQ